MTRRCGPTDRPVPRQRPVALAEWPMNVRVQIPAAGVASGPPTRFIDGSLMPRPGGTERIRTLPRMGRASEKAGDRGASLAARVRIELGTERRNVQGRHILWSWGSSATPPQDPFCGSRRSPAGSEPGEPGGAGSKGCRGPSPGSAGCPESRAGAGAGGSPGFQRLAALPYGRYLVC